MEPLRKDLMNLEDQFDEGENEAIENCLKYMDNIREFRYTCTISNLYIPIESL